MASGNKIFSCHFETERVIALITLDFHENSNKNYRKISLKFYQIIFSYSKKKKSLSLFSLNPVVKWVTLLFYHTWDFAFILLVPVIFHFGHIQLNHYNQWSVRLCKMHSILYTPVDTDKIFRKKINFSRIIPNKANIILKAKVSWKLCGSFNHDR